MARFEKGQKAGPGRPKGTLNRSTEQMKLTIARAVNHQLGQLQKDLDEIRKENPVKAMELAIKLMEYTIPKLKSVDMTIDAEVVSKVEQITVEVITKQKQNAAEHTNE